MGHTCLNSSRVGTRRGRGGGSDARVSTSKEDAGAGRLWGEKVTAGASVSGSVIFVSCEVFMTEGVSKSEVASGDVDLRADACDAGTGSSCTRREDCYHQSPGFQSQRKTKGRHTSSASSTVTLSEHSFLAAGSSSTPAFSLSSAERTDRKGLLVGVAPLVVVVFFFKGLPTLPRSPLANLLVDEGDLGDLAMFRSRDPRGARLLVGVAFIVTKEGVFVLVSVNNNNTSGGAASKRAGSWCARAQVGGRRRKHATV